MHPQLPMKLVAQSRKPYPISLPGRTSTNAIAGRANERLYRIMELRSTQRGLSIRHKKIHEATIMLSVTQVHGDAKPPNHSEPRHSDAIVNETQAANVSTSSPRIENW